MAIDPQFEHCAEGANAAGGFDEKDKRAGPALASAFQTVKTKMQEYLDEGMTPRDAALRAGRESAENARAQSIKWKRSQLLNMTKRVPLREQMLARAMALADRGQKDAIYDAVFPKISGRNTITDAGGNRASTEALMHASRREFLVGMQQSLRGEGVLKALRAVKRGSPTERNIARELYELSARDSGDPAAKPGYTKDDFAAKVAGVFRKYQVRMRALLNNEGADIGDYAGYISSTAYDPDLIYRAKEGPFVDATLGRLNPRTFAGVDDPKAFLGGLWNDFSTGLHIKDNGVGMADPQFTGPGNLAKRISQGRVLHWKDADAWYDHMQDFSRGTLYEKVLGSLENGARQRALLTDWGTNPRAELANTTQWVKEQMHATGRYTEAVRAFEAGGVKAKRLQDLFAEVDGSANAPLTSLGAKIATGTRNLVAMADLGNLLFIHLNSFGTVPAELAYHGVPWLDAYRGQLADMMQAIGGDADRKRLASLIGAGVEGAHASTVSGGWLSDSLPGTMSKITNTYLHMTGLPLRVNAGKDGVALMLAHDLALEKGTAWPDLSPARRSILQQYSFTPEEWDTLRAAPDLAADRAGREYLTPDAAMRAPGDLSERARENLGLRLRAYLTDGADRAFITPNAADRYYARYGIAASPNTFPGQAARFFSQFHTWPMAAFRQGFGREMSGRMGANRIGGILHLMLSTTALAYAAGALEDWAKGEEPPPATPATFANALARGGGLGIAGDLLFGHSTWTGSSDAVLKNAAGPVLSQFPETWQLGVNAWNGAKSGDWGKFDANMTRFATRNAPFANVFYLRGALNYLFLDSLQETMNPGYLARHEQYVRQQEGRGYMSPETPGLGMFNPASHLQPFGR